MNEISPASARLIAGGLYSQAGNFLSHGNTGVDARTGQFTLHFTLPGLQANNLAGPVVTPALSFSPLASHTDYGFGRGWSMELSRLDLAAGSLRLTTGESFSLDRDKSEFSDGGELVFRDQKLKTFRVIQEGVAGQRFRIESKDGDTQWLVRQDGGSLALPEEVRSPEGRQAFLSWRPHGSGQYALTEVRDERRVLLRRDQSENGDEVYLHLFPDSAQACTFTLQLSGDQLTALILPDRDSRWTFRYDPHEGLLFPIGATGPLGSEDEVLYATGPEGHRLPPGAPLAYLPRVTSHRHSPGAGQPAIYRTYTKLGDANFLGYGAELPGGWRDGEENLYRTDDYQYKSIETLKDALGATLAEVERTWNRFHLQTEEVKRRQGKTVRTLTTYGDDPALSWERQPAWCQLPVKGVTRYEGDPSREDITQTSYDDYGNTLTQCHPDGRTERWIYYPVGGAEGCPDDDGLFVRWLQAHTRMPVTLPDGESGGALPTRTDYRYERLPLRQSDDRPFLVAVSEAAVVVTPEGDRPLGVTTQRYQTDVNNPHYAQIVQAVTTLNQLATTTDYTHTLAGTTLTVESTVTGHDGTATTESTTRDSLTGLTMRERNVNGVETAYDYDKLGRVIRRMEAPGTPYEASATCRYVTAGRERLRAVMAEETDITGQQRRIYLDGAGRRVREERRDEDITGEAFREIWRGTYNHEGQLESETAQDWRADRDTPISLTTEYRFDAWGQVSELIRPDRMIEHTQSDPLTLVTQRWHTSADGERSAQTEILHNKAGDVLKVTLRSPTGDTQRIEEWTHDGWHRPITHRVTVPGEASVTTQTRYDAHGRILSRTLADGSEVNWEYAAHSDGDHPISVTLTPPGGDPVLLGEQTFDGLGRQLTCSAGGQLDQLHYIKGQVPPVSRESTSGRMQTYRYEPLLNNRLIGLTQNDGSPESTYRYHPRLTQLVEAQGGLGQLAWTYSASGRLTAEHWTVDGKRNTTTWQNSLNGLLLTFTDVNGVEHRTEYDALGRPDQQQADTVTMRMTYDAFSRVSQMVTEDTGSGQSLQQTVGYDAFGREVSRQWLSISPAGRRQLTQTLGWTNLDQVARRRWEADGQLLSEESYQYDCRGRLTETTASGPEGPVDARTGKRIRQQRFTLNALDGYERVVTVYTDGTQNEMTFTYAAVAPDRPVKISHSYPTPRDFTLEYDADGRLIRDGQGRLLHWNADGQLSRASREDQECGYQYDPLGRLSEVKPNGVVKRRYYQGEHVVNEQGADETVTLLRTGSSVFAQTRISQAVREVLLTGSDGQGTVRLEAGTDDTRLVSYTAHGADAGEANSLIGYAGESRDAISGCYLLGSYRLYDPVLMMLLEPDSESPFGAGGLNRYAYCAGDPVNRIDPDGHSFWKWLIAGVGIALGVIGTIASFGAAAPVLAGGIAALTVSGALTVTSTVLGVVSLTTGVASLILEATGDESAAGILGWISLGTGIASAVTGLAPAATKAAQKASRFVGRWKQHGNVSRKASQSSGALGGPETIYRPPGQPDVAFFDDLYGQKIVAYRTHGNPSGQLMDSTGNWRTATEVAHNDILPRVSQLQIPDDQPMVLMACYAGRSGAAQDVANVLRRPVVSYSQANSIYAKSPDLLGEVWQLDAFDIFGNLVKQDKVSWIGNPTGGFEVAGMSYYFPRPVI
ncbi:RHS repeat-associated core domain-containing protein [Pseudomonas chlororaphis]|uniref:RHS repeat-associated core domain-containing protein n=1 Tax=Pseudomonas chlororaphis TaxID=587753 RepID=UPI0015E01DB7|nr:RHS repeat-associated core domain-containing protein [Pseudomonas chlororaphis]QLL10862.1 hypothetical protein H0I86_17535 [Pseudomonas chlororaphis subsp. aurantiaca]